MFHNYRSILDDLAPVLDDPQYPKRSSEYVGQTTAKKELEVAVKSAKMRKAPMGHVLLAHHGGGMGKTALGVLVAHMLGKKARVISGQVDATKARLILAEMADGDVLIYDEAHQVMDGGRKNAEWLLNFLQDAMVPGPMGMEKMPRVTMILCTTDPGKLLDTIIGRCQIQPVMEDYTDEEAALVAIATSKKVLVTEGLPALRKADAIAVAKAAANNPRAMRRLLSTLRDLVLTGESEVKNGRYDIAALLEYQGVTEDGLDRKAQKYLLVLKHEFMGKAGAKSIEDRLQAPGGLASTERLLMDKGLIVKTGTGRELTTLGSYRATDILNSMEVAA
jgi:Holliday junction DNA helicase RuvB